MENIRVLVACEESQTVCKAFRAQGFEAYSCDILPASGGKPEWHIQADAIETAYGQEWDLIIAHPDCTYLAVTGNKWFYHPDDAELPTKDRRPHPRFPNRVKQKEHAIWFFMKLYNAPAKFTAVENPVGIISTVFRKPDQYVHPYYFGDPHAKTTGLWLKELPKLIPTEMVEPQYYIYKDGRRDPLWHVESMKLEPKERARVRSKTFQGLANAMAKQWGDFIKSNIK